MKIHSVILAAALGVLTPWLATAASEPATAEQPATASGYTEGELKKIDTDQSKITIKHGPIDNLGMPGMTMVFRADPAVLGKFKAGDLVRFKADRVDGALKVTELVGR
ncbi:MAG: copper-binding protein [Burkholderiales bacterium]|nr:copper-binding protein [Burkholderiales bacterium]